MDIFLKPINESAKLPAAQEGRCTTTEIDKSERTLSHDGQFADKLNFIGQGCQVTLYLVTILVGEYLEITEFTPFSTERDMQVESQRYLCWWSVQCGLDFLQLVARPLRKGRVITDEVITNVCLGSLLWHGKAPNGEMVD